MVDRRGSDQTNLPSRQSTNIYVDALVMCGAMSAFTGPLVIEEVVPGRRWRLREAIRYEAGAEGSGIVIEVPAGFETDGATIPAALRVILAVWGTYGRAACVHDYLYSQIRLGLHRSTVFKAAWGEGIANPGLARAWADHEFYLAMRACGTSRPLAWLMWAAVRLFGQWHCRARE